MHASVANNALCLLYTWTLRMWERVLCTWSLDFSDKKTATISCQNPMAHENLYNFTLLILYINIIYVCISPVHARVHVCFHLYKVHYNIHRTHNCELFVLCILYMKKKTWRIGFFQWASRWVFFGLYHW